MCRFTALSLLVLTSLGQAADPPRYFELREDKATAGKLKVLEERIRDRLPRLYTKHGATLVGTFEPVENGEGLVYTLLGWPNSKARSQSWEAFNADPAVKAMMTDTDKDGKVVAKSQSWTMAPTAYSPDVKPEAKGHRIFEFRFYTVTPGSLDALHTRFQDHTLRLYEKHGIKSIGYWTVKADDNVSPDKVISLLAHNSVEAAKKSSAAFQADPSWTKAKLNSEKKIGTSLTTRDGIKAVLVKPTDESPLK